MLLTSAAHEPVSAVSLRDNEAMGVALNLLLLIPPTKPVIDTHTPQVTNNK